MRRIVYFSLLCSALSISASENKTRLSLHTQSVSLAKSLSDQGNKEQALESYLEALRYNEHDYESLYAAANLARDLEHFEQAAPLFQRAIALNPRNLQLILDAANMFNMIDELDTSIALYRKILDSNPLTLEALYNLGYTLKKKGLITQAIDIYTKIIALRPDYAHPHFSMSLAYLSLGDFERGWKEYEWRWKAYNETPKQFPQPTWRGEDLQGKTILLYAEQGLGDSFQFIRYAKLLKSMGALVVFETQGPLKKILSLCPYLDTVIAIGQPIPAFDYHLPLMSCPLVFNTTTKNVPCDIPYLEADHTLVSQWQQKLRSDPNFKIGICWQGNANYSTQFLRKTVAAKSLHAKEFIPLTHISGVSIYSLQKMNGTEQLTALSNAGIKTFDADFDQSHGRFMDTAAMIKNLDLVITIDTSIGHFAAALGTPTWILLPNPPDWRWMLDRADTPWYPNVRLFRQPTPGDWQAVIEEVVNALKKELIK